MPRLFMYYFYGGVESTVIERRQQQLGRMADFLPPVTFSVFDLHNYEAPQIKISDHAAPTKELS